MGRPQAPLERDGSPVREFAFWLRDLRHGSGLTYDQVAKTTHYGTSTLQAAASGDRLPTLKVAMAFVSACGGDEAVWHGYWTQVRRLLDPDRPAGVPESVVPPWAVPDQASRSEPHAPRNRPETDGWYIESFRALLRLDVEPIEAIEQRVVVATRDDIRELSTPICVPRHNGDSAMAYSLDADLMHGGSLELREQPYESYSRNVVALPRPLRTGERHEFALRVRLPAGQVMAPYYLHVPFRRTESFELRVRFAPGRLPAVVWPVSGAPTVTMEECSPNGETLVPDRCGEIHVTFAELRTGFGYGACWLGDPARELAADNFTICDRENGMLLPFGPCLRA
jgi:hypothetical protein